LRFLLLLLALRLGVLRQREQQAAAHHHRARVVAVLREQRRRRLVLAKAEQQRGEHAPCTHGIARVKLQTRLERLPCRAVILALIELDPNLRQPNARLRALFARQQRLKQRRPLE